MKNVKMNLSTLIPKPNKSNLYGANKVVINALCMMAAPVGISVIITMLVIFDGLGNALSISQIMGERMQDWVAAFKDISMEEAKPVAKIWATNISLFASVTLGLAILVTSLLGKQTRNVSITLTVISAFISLVGFEMFVVKKGDDIVELFSHGFVWLQSGFAFFLAAFPALALYRLSEYLRKNYGTIIDEFNLKVTERVVEDTEKEITGEKDESVGGSGMGKSPLKGYDLSFMTNKYQNLAG